MTDHSILVTRGRGHEAYRTKTLLGKGADWIEHAGCQQFHVSTVRTYVCQEDIRVLVVAKLVDLVHVG